MPDRYRIEEVQQSVYTCPCCEKQLKDGELIQKIMLIQEFWGHQLRVSSGFRCEKHNREIGGAKTSAHLRGLAVDVLTDGEEDRYHLIHFALWQGFPRVYVYANHVHMDIDECLPWPRFGIGIYKGSL